MGKLLLFSSEKVIILFLCFISLVCRKMSVISSHPSILRWNMNLESTVWHRGTQGVCLLSNPFYSRRMNWPMSWETRSVFLLCFVFVVHFCGHFINLSIVHNVFWFEIVLFVDHLCQILRLGKLFNQPSGFCSSGFTPVSYLHIIYVKWVNLVLWRLLVTLNAPSHPKSFLFCWKEKSHLLLYWVKQIKKKLHYGNEKFGGKLFFWQKKKKIVIILKLASFTLKTEFLGFLTLREQLETCVNILVVLVLFVTNRRLFEIICSSHEYTH